VLEEYPYQPLLDFYAGAHQKVSSIFPKYFDAL